MKALTDLRIVSHPPMLLSRPVHGPCWKAPSWPEEPDRADRSNSRKLGRQLANAMRRILNLVAEAPELRGSTKGHAASEGLQQRIRLAANLSGVLFGPTRAPGLMQQRLACLCEGVMAVLGDPDALTELHVSADAGCPAGLEETVLRVAHELVGNAVKHGMHARLLGRIEVTLESGNGRTTLTVSDDGWGCVEDPAPGQGLSLATFLADQHGGSVRLLRRSGRTVVTLKLPHGAGYEP